MGDFCYMNLNCEEKDVLLFEDMGFNREKADLKKGWVSMVDDEASGAHYDEITELVPGHRFFGFYGNGDNYLAHSFASNGRRYVEVKNHDGDDCAEFNKKGFFSDSERTNYLLYRHILGELDHGKDCCCVDERFLGVFNADPLLKIGSQGLTLAHLATEVPSQWMELVRRGFVDEQVLKAENDEGWSVAHYAGRHGGLDCVKELLRGEWIFWAKNDWSVFALAVAFGQAAALPWDMLTRKHLAVESESSRCLADIIKAEGLWERVPVSIRLALELTS